MDTDKTDKNLFIRVNLWFKFLYEQTENYSMFVLFGDYFYKGIRLHNGCRWKY